MRRDLWLLVSFLMALSLLLLACGQAAAPASPSPSGTPGAAPAPAVPAPVAAPTQETSQQEAVVPKADVPKYGGVATLGRADDLRDFDEVVGWHANASTIKLTNEELWGGDWARGPAGGHGTNETDWREAFDRWEFNTGYIAESWDISKPGTITVKIRQGIRYGLNPKSEASRLVNGRELTADDVAFSLTQYVTDSRSYLYRANPPLRQASVSAPDKWTVVIKVPPEEHGNAVSRFFDYASIVPPEVVKQYKDMSSWRNSVGSGPFMLTEVIPGSSITLIKNPNYWGKDPVGPGKGNQLPYLDAVRFLIIPDASTRQAAFRTGKLDTIGLGVDDVPRMLDQRPGLVYTKDYVGNPRPTAMRIDKPELPFKDVRVRRAMMMAIDFNGIIKSLYGGDGIAQTWPISLIKGYEDAYVSLDEAPASVKELYSYNPEKAKALLTEAGYPKGFKTTVITPSTVSIVDYYAILKDMWSKVGIELVLDIRETGVWNTIAQAKSHPEMIHSTRATIGSIYLASWFDGTGPSNSSYVNDPYVKESVAKMQVLRITDEKAANRLFKEVTTYALDQAWMIPMPQGANYSLWWPWLKNYSAESNMGFQNPPKWLTWVWYDTDLKKAMGY